MARNPSIQEALAAALSHREKAEQLLRRYSEARAENTIPEEDYKKMAALCRDHLQSSQVTINALRASAQRGLDKLTDQLRRAKAAQERLIRQSNEGAIAPRRANARSRKLHSLIHRLQNEQHMHRRLLEADTAAALGGFIDLPLDHYAKHVPRDTESRDLISLLFDFLFPFSVAFMVFLPWLDPPSGHASISLYQAAIDLAQIPKTVPFGTPAYLWILLFVLPLVSLPFAGMTTRTLASIGMMVTGLSVVIVAPLLIFTPLVFDPDVIGGGLLDIRAGAIGYILGGIALVLLGWRRWDMAIESSRTGAFARALACVVAAWFVLGLAITLIAGKPQIVSIQAALDAVDAPHIAITCCNNGRRPVSLFVPWPDGMTEALRASIPDGVVGIQVYLQSGNRSEPQMVPGSMLAWRVDEIDSPAATALTLDPGGCITTRARLEPLRAIAPELKQIRIAIIDARKRVIAETTVDLP